MKKIFLLLTILILTSCNREKKGDFIETSISENYSIEIPPLFEQTEEGSWKHKSHHCYLNTLIKNESNGNDINSEIKNFTKMLELTDDRYKGMTFARDENFEKNGLKGVILYYTNNLKKSGLGLVSTKCYITISAIKDMDSIIFIYSISLWDDVSDDISKSIKSIKRKPVTGKKQEHIVFDEGKAKKDGYQIFKEDNFIIKCNGKILLDRLRIEQYKQSGQPDNTRPYHVFVKGVDYNINAGDYAYILNGQSNEEINKYINESLDYFQTKLDEMEVKNQRKKFKNFDAVYYQNSSEGKLTKAVYFHDKMKSYTLQVSSSKNTDKLFDEFVNSFEIINK